MKLDIRVVTPEPTPYFDSATLTFDNEKDLEMLFMLVGSSCGTDMSENILNSTDYYNYRFTPKPSECSAFLGRLFDLLEKKLGYPLTKEKK